VIEDELINYLSDDQAGILERKEARRYVSLLVAKGIIQRVNSGSQNRKLKLDIDGENIDSILDHFRQ